MKNQIDSVKLEQLKNFFKSAYVKGTDKEMVERWNIIREDAKLHFDEIYISAIDASGYITKWMKGE